MTDLVISFGLWWGVSLAVILALSVFRAVKIQAGWLVVAIVIHAIYLTTNSIGLPILDLEVIFGDLAWNWDGKIFSVIATTFALVALTVCSRQVSFEAAGVTLRQNEGSVAPAWIATVILVVLVIAAEVAVSDGQSLGVERLVFQATMPGLDEELYFRGLLLLILSLSICSAGANILGASISWAGMLTTLLFGLGHSLFWQDAAVGFSSAAFIYTFILGFGLLWIRQRTGSILIPILAHNLINVSGSFF